MCVFLSGGFSEFSHLFPGLCEGKSTLVPSCISQPCLPVTNVGPTRILPHLYLGCQRDVLNKVQQIRFILNVIVCIYVPCLCSMKVLKHISVFQNKSAALLKLTQGYQINA